MSIEHLRHPANLFTIAPTDPYFGLALQLVGSDLRDQGVSTALRDREGRPLLLA
jgi:hypothetical protein